MLYFLSLMLSNGGLYQNPNTTDNMAKGANLKAKPYFRAFPNTKTGTKHTKGYGDRVEIKPKSPLKKRLKGNSEKGFTRHSCGTRNPKALCVKPYGLFQKQVCVLPKAVKHAMQTWKGN